MILTTDEVIDKINNANKITVFYNLRNLSAYSAACLFNYLNNYSKEVVLRNQKKGGIPSARQIDFGSDLNLFLGIYRIPTEYLVNENSLVIDDSFSDSAFSPSTNFYISNKKNFAKSETTSTASFAHHVLEEFGIDVPFGLELLSMVGDRYDNRELGMTEFTKLISQKYDMKKIPNLLDMSEYSLFNFPTFLIFYDYPSSIDFEYEIKETNDKKYVSNKMNIEKFLGSLKDLTKAQILYKLEDMFKEQRIPERIHRVTGIKFTIEDLLYAPAYFNKRYGTLVSLDEMERGLKIHLSQKDLIKRDLIDPMKNSFWIYTKKLIEANKENIIEKVNKDLKLYEKLEIEFLKVGNIGLFGVNMRENFRSKWNWLPFFPWNSFFG